MNESERRFLPLEMKGEVTDEIGDGSVKHTSVLPLAVQIKANLEAEPFITYVELSEIIGVAPRTIARKIKELQEAGEIRRVGADKNGHWEVVRRSYAE